MCFCNKSGTPDCLPLSHRTKFSIYPGQKISISAVVVGQNFGTVAGSVFAQFFYSKPTPQLDVRESAQEVQHIHCNHLVYTILSPLEDYHTVLINSRRACAARVTVVVLSVCLSVCAHSILGLQATRRLMSDTNSFSATREEKNVAILLKPLRSGDMA